MMPGLVEVEHHMRGVYLLLRRRKDGFDWLDISADGFWRSFAAILYAAPALAVTWASYRMAYLVHADDGLDAGPAFILSLAIIDVATWIVPIVLLGFAARPLGISRHFARFVIATNWLGVPTSYATAVPAVLSLVFGGAVEAVAAFLSIAVFVLTIAALFRLTRLSLDGQLGSAAIVTTAMVVLSLMTTGLLQHLLGVAIS